MEKKKKFAFDIRAVVGILIISAGVILLMDAMGFDLNIDVWDFWPLILIALGMKKILNHSCRKHYVTGGLLIFFGIILLLRNLDILYFTFSDIWPVILILIGIGIIKNGILPDSHHNHHGFRNSKLEGEELKGDSINISSILGGGEYKFSSKKLNGGKISAIMGGCEIDLRNSDFTGNTLKVEVFALMGGIEIMVPQKWTVVTQGTPILGAFENKTTTLNGNKKKIIIYGTAIMGGVEIKN